MVDAEVGDEGAVGGVEVAAVDDVLLRDADEHVVERNELGRGLGLDLLEVVAEAGFGGAPVGDGVARISPVVLSLVSYQSRSMEGLPLRSRAS